MSKVGRKEPPASSPRPPPAGRIDIFVLGPPRIEHDGAAVRFDTRKTYALLLFLAVDRQHHQREFLTDLLWPESDERRGRQLLRSSLSVLRKRLGADLLDADTNSVALHPDAAVWLDLRRFRDLLLDSLDQRATPERAAALLEAVGLYRGEPLSGFHANSETFDSWQQALVSSARSLLGALFAELVESLERTDLEQAQRIAARWLELESASEPAHREMMRVLALAGDRAGALEQYARCVRILDQELQVGPDASTELLAAAIRSGELAAVDQTAQAENAAPPPQPAVRGKLPRRLDRFIGRERELDAASERLLRGPGVTLVGPAGVGKTRLATEVAARAAPRFVAGAWFVSLAPVSHEQQVEAVVAAALEMPERSRQTRRDALVGFLADRHLLIVLDNCEHVLGACQELVATLLERCPRVAVLATSREALRYRGEQVMPVEPLAVPQSAALAAVGASSAVRLFIERAAAAAGTFAVDEHNAAAAAEICRRVDGLPLALELAAAQVAVMPLDQLRAGLDDAIVTRAPAPGADSAGVHTGDPRHQTLGAAIGWSYALLDPAGRRLLRELSVFDGGFTAEAAMAISTIAGEQVAGLLAQLTGKSMVSLTRSRQDRYQLLATVREFAAGELRRARRETVLRRRHRDWFVQLARRAEPELIGERQLYWCDTLDAERDNLRQAVSWSLSCGEPQAAIDIGIALFWFWQTRDYHRETLEWLEQALADSDTMDVLTRARAHVTACWSGWCCGDTDAAERHGDRAAALLEAGGAPDSHIGSADDWDWWYGFALMSRAWTDLTSNTGANRYEEAKRALRQSGNLWGLAIALMFEGTNVGIDVGRRGHALRQSLQLARQVGDRTTMVWTLRALGQNAEDEGEYLPAQAWHEEALLIADQLRFPSGIAQARRGVASVLAKRGDHRAARHQLRLALGGYRDAGFARFYITSIGTAASIELGAGDADVAARLFGAAYGISRQLQLVVLYDMQRDSATIDHIRGLLGEQRFGREWHRGTAMSLGDVLDLLASRDASAAP